MMRVRAQEYSKDESLSLWPADYVGTLSCSILVSKQNRRRRRGCRVPKYRNDWDDICTQPYDESNRVYRKLQDMSLDIAGHDTSVDT